MALLQGYENNYRKSLYKPRSAVKMGIVITDGIFIILSISVIKLLFTAGNFTVV